MARKPDFPGKNVSRNVRVPEEVDEFMDELHWTKRIPLARIYRDAVIDYAFASGFTGTVDDADEK